MAKANLQLIYVSDIRYSTVLYTNLLDEPHTVTPRYVAFSADDKGKSTFALWAGEKPIPDLKRSNEVGIMLEADSDVDEAFENYKCLPGITVIDPPCNHVFGRSFLLKDPDGHLIRVCSRD